MIIYDSLLDRLRSQQLTIIELIKGLPSNQLHIRPAINKWNIHDNIAHLARYQVVFIERINIILSENSPHFERYKAENDPGFESFRKQETTDLLKFLNDHRLKLNEFIFRLSESEFERCGVHKKFGKLNIVQWLEFFVLHEAHHIYTIFQLRNDVDLKKNNDK